MGSLRRAAGLAGGALLSGTFGYCFVDAATDALTFRILRRFAHIKPNDPPPSSPIPFPTRIFYPQTHPASHAPLE
jgi:hypothetical protein